MCASVIPFIPSLNDQNQLSVLKCLRSFNARRKRLVFTTGSSKDYEIVDGRFVMKNNNI